MTITTAERTAPAWADHSTSSGEDGAVLHESRSVFVNDMFEAAAVEVYTAAFRGHHQTVAAHTTVIVPNGPAHLNPANTADLILALTASLRLIDPRAAAQVVAQLIREQV